ncbi:Hpt domain-containing protein [Limnofasciculus baicalensis]|uniref:Hpt domain-containing protein n=1 Tax=Limnofasciculus baicalensis BBK-W-15 TaxID=2699891 RepID=A0AAE3GXU5_9CYAN|nr:Hpt domain-containing protein [Limnofasciculus baicalensis]MCP2731838.1 Hpt domain-containing protein [Limnofasciculus baicalensis BBK-W-15]
MLQSDFSLTDGYKEPMVDLDRLKEITLGQVELQRELITAFIEILRANLDAIQEALPSGDCLTVSRCAHQIKGAAANVGIPSIKEIAAELERQANEQNLVNATQLLVDLDDRRSQLQEFISNYLS